jgi:alpha-L-arabinofuranosidase
MSSTAAHIYIDTHRVISPISPLLFSGFAEHIVNRSQTDSLVTELCWQGLAPQQITAVHQLAGSDPKAANTFEHPDRLKTVQVAVPAVEGKTATLALPPLSFTVVEVGAVQ